jgi:hypothetical protein
MYIVLNCFKSKVCPCIPFVYCTYKYFIYLFSNCWICLLLCSIIVDANSDRVVDGGSPQVTMCVLSALSMYVVFPATNLPFIAGAYVTAITRITQNSTSALLCSSRTSDIFAHRTSLANEHASYNQLFCSFW